MPTQYVQFDGKISSNHLIKAVTELFHDIDSFAKLAARVDIRSYSFEEIEAFQYPINVLYISLNKSFVNDCKHAMINLRLKGKYEYVH